MTIKDTIVYVSEGDLTRIENLRKSMVIIQRPDLGRVFRLNLNTAEFTSSSTMLVPKGSFARLTATNRKGENSEVIQVNRKLFHIPKEFKMIRQHLNTSAVFCPLHRLHLEGWISSVR